MALLFFFFVFFFFFVNKKKYFCFYRNQSVWKEKLGRSKNYKMLLGLFETLSGCYYLFIYAYNSKTALIFLYHVLAAKLKPHFIFPNLLH